MRALKQGLYLASECAKLMYASASGSQSSNDKLHMAFMAEVGDEMCQPEIAHIANSSPE